MQSGSTEPRVITKRGGRGNKFQPKAYKVAKSLVTRRHRRVWRLQLKVCTDFDSLVFDVEPLDRWW